MQDSDKRVFWTTINVTMENYNRPALTKESIMVWYNTLQHLTIEQVIDACDSWIHDSSKAPTMRDILDLCRPKQQFHKALPVFRDEEIQKEGLEKINQIVSKSIEQKKDYRAWAKKILANPKNYPDISIKFAKEALNVE